MSDKNGDILSAMQNMKTIIEKDKTGTKKVKSTITPPSFVGTPINRTPDKMHGDRPMKKKVMKKKVKKVPKPQAVNPGMINMFSILENEAKTGPPSIHKEQMKSSLKKKKKYQTSSSGASSSSASSVSSGSSRSSGSSGSSRSSRSSGSSGSRSDESSCGESSSRRIDQEKKRRRDELIHEKVEMLTRIVNLSKDGFATTKKWNMKDDIDEVRYECYRLQRESNTKNSVEMMRHVLISITTLIEMGNARYNPFNLRLDGFSKSMMMNLPSYDSCFVKLHHKYTGKSSVGPEMQLLFSFVSAAVYQHAGNAISQKDDSKPKSSANPISAMMGMMGALGGMGGGAKSAPARSPVPTPVVQTNVTNEPHVTTLPTGPVTGVSPQYDSKPKRRTMRGPGSQTASIPSSILGAISTPSSGSTVPSMTIPI